jgi:hypothetical protein
MQKVDREVARMPIGSQVSIVLMILLVALVALPTRRRATPTAGAVEDGTATPSVSTPSVEVHRLMRPARARLRAPDADETKAEGAETVALLFLLLKNGGGAR